MAQRRMFSKDIVCSDSFLDMPPSTQLLYYQFGMEADDDGFLGSPNKLIRAFGANKDELKILISKKFVIPFESGVIVIRHWRENNQIRSDRYKETLFLDEKNQLKEGGNGWYEIGIPNGNQNDTIGKPSIGKDSIGKDTSDETSQKVFSLQEEIKKLEDNPRRDLNIIAMYLENKKPDIRSPEQLSVAIKRHLRGAKQLCPFTDQQILDVVPKAKKLTEEYTLETLVKCLTK